MGDYFQGVLGMMGIGYKIYFLCFKLYSSKESELLLRG